MERSAKARLNDEDLTLQCIVCGEAIEEGRARRGSHVCGAKCKNRLDYVVAEFRRNKKCPHCLSPSTPEERELYRLFRVWLNSEAGKDYYARYGITTGGKGSSLRSFEKVARDQKFAHRQALLRALRVSTDALIEERDEIIRSYSVPAAEGQEVPGEPILSDDGREIFEKLTALIERNEELLDKKAE